MGRGRPCDLPPCPGVEAYEEIANNAFFCPQADLIAWDEALISFFRTDAAEAGRMVASQNPDVGPLTIAPARATHAAGGPRGVVEAKHGAAKLAAGAMRAKHGNGASNGVVLDLGLDEASDADFGRY